MMKPAYLSPSEAKELRTICSELDTPAHENELEEFDVEERNYASRTGYAAMIDASDPLAFFEGGAGYGLHPRHAAHVNRQTVNRALGWGGWR